MPLGPGNSKQTNAFYCQHSCTVTVSVLGHSPRPISQVERVCHHYIKTISVPININTGTVNCIKETIKQMLNDTIS